MNIKDIKTLLLGRVIFDVKETNEGDEGLLITFTNGLTLEFAYSSNEGSTWVDNKSIKETYYYGRKEN